MPVDPVLLDKVRLICSEVLQIEPDELTAESSFAADHGGESLDFLDLGFRFERAFGVPVRFQDLSSQELSVTPEGTLTPESLQKIQARFPLLEVSRWKDRRFDRPLDLLSIGDIAAIVAGELERPAAKAG